MKAGMNSLSRKNRGRNRLWQSMKNRFMVILISRDNHQYCCRTLAINSGSNQKIRRRIRDASGIPGTPSFFFDFFSKYYCYSIPAHCYLLPGYCHACFYHLHHPLCRIDYILFRFIHCFLQRNRPAHCGFHPGYSLFKNLPRVLFH